MDGEAWIVERSFRPGQWLAWYCARDKEGAEVIAEGSRIDRPGAHYRVARYVRADDAPVEKAPAP